MRKLTEGNYYWDLCYVFPPSEDGCGYTGHERYIGDERDIQLRVDYLAARGYMVSVEKVV